MLSSVMIFSPEFFQFHTPHSELRTALLLPVPSAYEHDIAFLEA
jgi:hypothetical protein